MVPDFPGLGRLHVGDGALLEVNVEAQKVKVIHRFQFDGIAEKIVVDEEVFVVDNETVVHIPIVCEVEGSVLKKTGWRPFVGWRRLRGPCVCRCAVVWLLQRMPVCAL